MRSLSLLLVVGLVNEAHCFLRLHAVKRQDPDAEAIRKELEETQKKVDEAQKDLADKLQRGPASEAPKKDGGAEAKDPKKDEAPAAEASKKSEGAESKDVKTKQAAGDADPKKKKMDPIEVVKAMLCWGRPHLIQDKKCMTWMVQNCQKESSGEGYCKKLRRYVKSKCKKGSEKGCAYAKDIGIDVATDKEVIDPDDEDGDGVPDKDDAFPDNPVESKDSDGDGVGDNTDKWPNDKSCSKEGDVCSGASPAPAMAAAPAPSGLTMDEGIPVPSQGYDEHSGKSVAHDDGKTMTSDWRNEWPMSGGDEETSIDKICAKNPDLKWCKLRGSSAARKAYVISHP